MHNKPTKLAPDKSRVERNNIDMTPHQSLVPFLALFIVTPHVMSGGFQLSDHSVASLGRSHAGYGIVGDDASAVHFNPAGMSLLKQQQVQIGVTYININAPYTDINSTGANIGAEEDGTEDSLIPNFYWVKPINDKTHIGLGVTVPLGTNTHYSEDFIGRFDNLETRLETLDINPSVSYKVNDWISIGAGLSYQILEAVLSRALSPSTAGAKVKIAGDSSGVGYNAGIMFSFSNQSRLGISYRSEVTHDLEGSAIFSGLTTGNGTFDSSTQFITPETLHVGYTQQLNDHWRLSLGYRWTEWSTFERLFISFPDAPLTQSSTTDANWKDSSTVVAGIDYQLQPKWVLRAGLAFDNTPVPNATRSTTTVDADRIWYSAGAGYQATEKLQLDMAYRYIDIDHAGIDRTTGPNGSFGSLNGEFSNSSVHTLSIQANYTY